MPCSTDPKTYGLSTRVTLCAIDEAHLVIVMDRKSRIIMADGRKIMKKVEAIQSTCPDVRVSLMTSAPLCSKTLAYLQENLVAVLKRDDFELDAARCAKRDFVA